MSNGSNPKSFFLKTFLLPSYKRELLIKKESKRFIVTSFDEYLRHLGKEDVYYSIRSVEDLLADQWDRVYMDFDAHGKPLSEAKEKAKVAVKALMDMGLKLVVVFTGRGYHAYILLAESIPLNIDDLKPYWVALGSDPAVLNTNPMARLPFTINSKTGTEAIPVNPETLEEPYYSVEVNEPEAFKEVFSINGSGKSKNDIERSVLFGKGMGTKPPHCIREMLLKGTATGYLNHQERFALASFGLRVWGYERMKRFFSLMDDYQEYVTTYQLSHIRSRKYLYPSCNTLLALGVCEPWMVERCPFYPWLEPYLPEWSDTNNDEGGGNEG